MSIVVKSAEPAEARRGRNPTAPIGKVMDKNDDDQLDEPSPTSRGYPRLSILECFANGNLELRSVWQIALPDV
jgi:hypothetical protein